MKVIQEIRLENLRTIIEKVGGVTRLADLVKRSQPQISQLLNESKDESGKPRVISDFMARLIEDATGAERGWMDNDHASLARMLRQAADQIEGGKPGRPERTQRRRAA